jgi:hypothetical protein
MASRVARDLEVEVFCVLLIVVALNALLSRKPKTAVFAAQLIVWLARGLDGFQPLINAHNWSLVILLPLIAALCLESFDTPESSPHTPIHAVLLVLTLRRTFLATHRTHAAL